MYTRDTAPARGALTKSKARKQSVPQITVAVMGATGSGKTSFINMASGSSLRIGTNLQSCTAEVQLGDEFILDGHPVILIDTPGFDDTTKSDTDILQLIAAFLATAYEAGSKLAGVIYVHRISDRRFGGIASRNFNMFRELCGDTTLKNVTFVTNMWGDVPQDVGEAREEELTGDFFKPALKKGARLARHYNTMQSAHDIIRSVMNNRPAALQIQRELVDEGKGIIDTAAGETINKELNDKIRHYQAELKAAREEMEKTLEKKDEEFKKALKERDEEMMRVLREQGDETREELEEETRKLQEQILKMRMDSENMASGYQAEKRKMEDAMKQMQDQEQARKERERIEDNFRKEMEDLFKQLREATEASVAERVAMQKRINELQQQIDDRPQEGGGGCVVI